MGCDQNFGECMKDLCKSMFSHNPQCEQAANMYVMGVSMFGGGGFAESQNEYCECKGGSKAGAITHYKDLFSKFYKEYTGKPANEAASKTIDIMGKSANDYSGKNLKKIAEDIFEIDDKVPPEYTACAWPRWSQECSIHPRCVPTEEEGREESEEKSEKE